MKITRLFAPVLLALSLCVTASAQTSAKLSAADEQGIDLTLTAFGQTLTAMDFDTFATLFTDNADFVNIVGMHWSGRAQIVKAHRIVFTTRYKGNP